MTPAVPASSELTKSHGIAVGPDGGPTNTIPAVFTIGLAVDQWLADELSAGMTASADFDTALAAILGWAGLVSSCRAASGMAGMQALAAANEGSVSLVYDPPSPRIRGDHQLARSINNRPECGARPLNGRRGQGDPGEHRYRNRRDGSPLRLRG